MTLKKSKNYSTEIIWISYDLGISGDYTGLYTWLDKHQAKECGDSLAVIKMEIKGDVISTLKREIKKNVKLSPTDRIYIIYKDKTNGSVVGVFLFGGRKHAPWAGYGQTDLMNIKDY